MKLRDVEILNKFIPHENRIRAEIDYWNPNTLSYESGAFYITDVKYSMVNVDEKRRDILYKPITVSITEY